MTYILIFIFISSQKSAAVSVEFDNLAACKAAATEVTRQAVAAQGGYAPVVLCTKKG